MGSKNEPSKPYTGEPPQVFTLHFNEDGDPPWFQTFSSSDEWLSYVRSNGVKDTDIIDLESFNPESDTGYLVIEGRALKLVPKKVVEEWSVE